MSVLDQKKKVFGKIAALRVSAEGYPKKAKQLLNSIPSVSAITNNTLNYLIDLLKSLIGFEALKETLLKVLTDNLEDIELEVKKTLKKSLKSMVSCGINPTIPQWLITDGVTIEVNRIDFLDIMKIAPDSKAGKLIYDDIYNASQSTDFNTYLYHVLQNNGGPLSWGGITSDNDIFDISFKMTGSTPTELNNMLNIKASGIWDEEKLTDLNNSFIDSVTLFSSPKLINNIIDSIFGSISVDINKDKRSIENNIKIDEIINRIINADDDETIDDTYFSFTNDEYQDIEYRTNLRSKGIDMIETDASLESSVSIDSLVTLNDELDVLLNQTQTSALQGQIKTSVRDGIDKLAEESASNANEKDVMSIKLNFMEKMLKNLMTSIINIVLSPKLVFIFAINHKIIYGENFDSLEDFMKKNKWLITMVLESVRDIIVSLLMKEVLKKIKELAIDDFIKRQKERLLAKKLQMASLSGTPSKFLKKMREASNNIINKF